MVMPKDRSAVTTDRLLVFGKGDPSQSLTVGIENPAGSQKGAVQCDGAGQFKFQIRLEGGVNRIQVGDVRREVFLKGAGGQPPPGFLPLYLHAGGNQKCTSCHAPDGQVVGGGYPDVCLQCHSIEAANPRYRGPLTKERHFQVSGSQCGKCHDPHGERD
ncbi:MAG: hypothetical protein P1P84_21010, partial [Deferrisomatales bacterium]|nr:hypothetical protein [Deferrisomatales bacterium]